LQNGAAFLFEGRGIGRNSTSLFFGFGGCGVRPVAGCFLVDSAALDPAGRVSVSPEGLNTFRILDAGAGLSRLDGEWD
jgi:hypothetical protein